MGMKKRNKWFIISFSAVVFFVLLLSLNIIRASIVFLAALASYYLIYKSRKRDLRFQREYILIELALLMLAATWFFEYWSVAHKVKLIASKLSMQSDALLLLIALFCMAVSFYGLNVLLGCAANHRVVRKFHFWLQGYNLMKRGLLLFLIVSAQLFQLQRSSLDDRAFLFRVSPLYSVANAFFLLMIYMLLLLAFRKERVAAIISCLIVTIYSIANYYVIMFHGSPLFPNEFANARTAWNVLSSYSVKIGTQVIDIIALFLAELYLSRKLPSETTMRITSRILLFGGNVAVVFALFFSPVSLKERYSFSWKLNIVYDGFVHSAISNLQKCLHPLQKPDDYDANKIKVPSVNNQTITKQRPDIIVIINESFCDLSVFSDVTTDLDYLDKFYEIEGARYGYSFSPEIGGGTNKTEFEVLTSDSMFMLTGSAPFSYIRFNEKNSTFLTYLKSLGYESFAMHSMPASNYNREFAYPAMGFDHVFLGDERVCEVNYYGNRKVLDKDEYKGLITLFEQETEQPRFFYLLTFQNHGGYEQNDASLDQIHTTEDYGDLTDDINEYLTSVSQSAAAVHELIHYLSKSERPVVLCMVGDHAPCFINQLCGKRDMTSDETEVWQRAVPFVIWTNFNNQTPEDTIFASMTDLVPMMLEVAGLPLTPFYQQVLNVHESIPVRTPYGICMDSDGTIQHFNESVFLNEDMRQYFFMEYNELHLGEDYIPELFQVP